MTARVDLRSDTVTRPTDPMRAAMAAAEVGDDVYEEDPTINRLQEEVAGRFDRDASLFVPSGMMANSIWMGVLAGPGTEVLVEADAHLVTFESGAPAANTGTQFQTLIGDRGRLSAEQIRAATRPDRFPYTRTVAAALEHTTNRHGGTYYALADLDDIRAAADERGLAVYMDGARIFNATVAAGVSASTVAARVDGLSFCFSKGLGAPVGSILVGDADAIAEARAWRHRLGGQMRQAGVLAAACLHALEHHVERLAEDHANARLIAEVIAAAAPGATDPAEVPTNIVYVETGGTPASRIVDELADEGILLGAMGPSVLRIVTHLDVDTDGCRRAAEAIAARLA